MTEKAGRRDGPDTPAHGKAAMKRDRPSHPGLERDAHGDPIPMAKRLAEDRQKTGIRRATRRGENRNRGPLRNYDGDTPLEQQRKMGDLMRSALLWLIGVPIPIIIIIWLISGHA
jgi:hypothetical protein